MYKLYYLTSSLDEYKPRYVGYASDIKKRLSGHINDAKYNKCKSHKVNWIKKLIKENEKLKKKNKNLKKLVKLITSNVSLLTLENLNNVCKCKPNKLPKLSRKYKDIVIKEEEPIECDNEITYIDDEVNNIVYEILINNEEEEAEEVEEAEEEEEEAEEEAEEEEEVEEAEEEEEVEEAEEEEAEEEEAEEEEPEEEEAEVEVDEEEEEVVEEEEEDEEEEAEEEEAEEEEAEEEEAEVYEVNISGKTYYTSNEISGVIYGVDEDGDVSLEVGKYVRGNPVFL